MYLGLIEARYDYQMSYLDNWASTWKKQAQRSKTFNLVRTGEVKKLKQQFGVFDLIVVLHSVTADSNLWLKKLAELSALSRAPMILYVGNEFSSPFLSTETRLNLIEQLSPEVIASQLPIESAEWLYARMKSKVVSTPPGIPEYKVDFTQIYRPIDLGFRGFRYPWYVLDRDRNETIDSVTSLFRTLGKKIDVSHTKRFGSRHWFEFLSKSHFTMSTEAGSTFVFRDDEVWMPVHEYFSKQHRFSAIRNDAIGMRFFRQMPAPLKNLTKYLLSILGIRQASLYQPNPQEEEIVKNLVDPSKYDYRSGKAISSRHLDAIACGTWQILKTGEYNNILISGKHFTPWDSSNLSPVLELMADAKLLSTMTQNALESLKDEHSYDARVRLLIENIR